MKDKRPTREAILVGLLLMSARCGGSAPAAPSSGANAADHGAPPTAVAAVDAPGPVQATATDFTPLVAHIEETEAGKTLGADIGKLGTLATLSPKTQKALLKNHLWKAVGECNSIPLVDVKPMQGLMVPNGKTPKVRDKVYESLKAAAALATQRGMAIEVVSGQVSVADAVKEYNHSIIELAYKLAKAAPPPEQKEKSFAGAAQKELGDDGPQSWDHTSCDSGRLGGWSVLVQLVGIDALGKRGAVLVKAGDDSERFTRDSFESIYWNKPKGKSFRMLTEIMAGGKFVRQCSRACSFSTSPSTDSTWRCKEGTDSWDPPNRPIPAWQ